MFKIKPLLKFLLVFVVTYVALLMVAKNVENPYAQSYRWLGKALFENYGTKGFLQFFPIEEESTYRLSTKVVIFNKHQIRSAKQSGQATVKGAELLVSSWYNGLLPIVILLSLIVASPVPWKRKLLATLIGLILLYLFFILKWKLSIAWEIQQNKWLDIPTRSPGLVKTGHAIFVENIETTIIVPVFIWIAVTFRKRDIQ